MKNKSYLKLLSIDHLIPLLHFTDKETLTWRSYGKNQWQHSYLVLEPDSELNPYHFWSRTHLYITDHTTIFLGEKILAISLGVFVMHLKINVV